MFAQAYRLAGLVVQVESDLSLFDFRSEQFLPFHVPPGTPDIVCSLRQVCAADMVLPQLSSAEIDRLTSLFHITPVNWNSPLLGAAAVRRRLLDADDTPGSVSIEIARDLVSIYDFAHHRLHLFYRAESAIGHIPRYVGTGFVAPFLPAFGAALLHSSCVLRGDVAAMFIAPDEGGKTTAAELAPDSIVLGDDQNIVRFHETLPVVYGTPWGRRTDSTHQARLGGLFFLEKASVCELLPCAPGDALEQVWQDHWSYYTPLPPRHRLAAVSLLARLTRHIPTYRLRFPADHIDWDAIETVIAEPPRMRS